MAFKPVGVDENGLFPTRVLTALKGIFSEKSKLATVATSGSYNDLLNKPTGTGGSSAPVNVINVDSYGAKGDGTTDDLASINSAIAALVDGATLEFTRGKTYYASDRIFISNKSGISVIMTGAVIVGNGTTDASAVVRIDNCAHVYVHGGYLYHKTAASRKNEADGLSIMNSSSVLVQNVRVGYTYSMGIRAGGSKRVTIQGCYVEGTMADGIGAYGAERYSDTGDGAMNSGSKVLTSTTTKFRSHDVGGKVTVPGAGSGGADLVTSIASYQSASQVTLTDAASTTVTGKFIRLQRASTDISIIGNHLVSTGDDAISSVGYLFIGSPNTDFTVIGNTIIDSKARGILMCGTSRASITGNVMRNILMGGIYCITETGGVTSFGCTDIVIDANVLETICTDYANGANYPAIGGGSASNTYPLMNIIISNNSIRDAYSYYIEAGSYSNDNNSTSAQEITIRGNVCLGGNRNNQGILVLKATNVTVENNRVARARTSAIAISSEVAGFVVIRGNNFSQWDRIAGGWGGMDIGPTSPAPIVQNNILNGVLVASGTSGGGSNT